MTLLNQNTNYPLNKYRTNPFKNILASSTGGLQDKAPSLLSEFKRRIEAAKLRNVKINF